MTIPLRALAGASLVVFATIAACGADSTVTTPPVVKTDTIPVPATPKSAIVSPSKNDSAAHSDTRITVSFDAAPVLGAAGFIRIFKSDGTPVDSIDISGAPVTSGGETQTTFPRANTEIDKVGNNVASLTQWRFVYYRPVSISGTVATVKLHDGVLDFGTSYYVTIDSGVFNAPVDGKAFAGFRARTDWPFRTKVAPTTLTVTVDDDGPADFRSVQGALNWAMRVGCNSCANAGVEKTISVKNGTYDELLFARNVSNVTIRGESRAGVIVRANNCDAINSGTGGSRTAPNTTFANIGGNTALGNRRVLGGGRAVLLIEGGDLIKLTNFTLQNTHVKDAVTNGQAETIYFNSTSLTGARFVATDMNFVSTQDTMQFKGWVWIYNSLIAGDVDFVWGSPYAVVLENDEVRTVFDTSVPSSGGYIFQSRSAKGFPGFVVLNSTLTADATVPAASTFLGRSAGQTVAAGNCATPTTTGSLANANIFCDNIAYINTKMGQHIALNGWWNSPLPVVAATATEGWRESGSMTAAGTPANLAFRDVSVSSSSLDLSALNSRTKVFAAWNSNAGWNPVP